jgi:hypothetical protein
METEDIMDTPQAFTPAISNGNGHVAAQALVEQILFEQTLLGINGHLGTLSLAQYMALSGNALKLAEYVSSAQGVVIPFQQHLLPLGIGLRDPRTVVRALKELWEHECIEVHFDQLALDDPLGLRVQGKKVVLKTENGLMTINRIYVRYVGFPEQIPERVAQAMDERLKRHIDYLEERVRELKREKAQWEQRTRWQQKHGDSPKSESSEEADTGNGQGSEEAIQDSERR